MESKIVDTNIEISQAGRAERYWRGKRVHHKSSNPGRMTVDLHKILKTYNLKGFEFGNWLNNDERYDRVIACEDSLAELAKILGSKNMGMNCLLGVAFGARGKSRALAHYEPTFNMINITKEKGDGCLAHELAHALDYNIGRYHDQNKSYNFLSGGDSIAMSLKNNIGGPTRNAMNALIDEANVFIRPRIKAREDYWKERTEIWARLFEQYCSYKLKKNGSMDKFLTRSWLYYTSSAVYWTETEFKQLLPSIEKLVGCIKTVLNSK